MSKNGIPGCSARQVSDQMDCAKCGLVWDMNDPDPPACQLNPPTRDLSELLVGEVVVVDGVVTGKVVGFKTIAGETYLALEGWRCPVLSERCEPMLQ